MGYKKRYYKIADQTFCLKFCYEQIINFLKDFEIEKPKKVDFKLKTTMKLIKDEGPELIRNENIDINKVPLSYLESLAIHRLLCEELFNYDTIIFHSSSVQYGGNGFMFTAVSGTGKSTHVRLLKGLLGDKLSVVNDDKPFVKIVDDLPYIYGSPWNGKHRIGENTKVPLKAICFLNRGETNSIKKVNPLDYFTEIFQQTLRPNETKKVNNMINILNKILSKVDFYVLYCNMEPDAPECSFRGMISNYVSI